jgi:hypothetical protein
MKGYPPVILVETWIYLATNRSSELDHIKLINSKNINHFFGSVELALLYVEQVKNNNINVYFV